MLGAFLVIITVGVTAMNPGAAAVIAGTLVLGNLAEGTKK